MTPRPKSDPENADDTDKRDIEQTDWDGVAGEEIDPVAVPGTDDLDFQAPADDLVGDLPEEDDDNPYQESDAALPEDSEEEAISRRLRVPERREEGE